MAGPPGAPGENGTNGTGMMANGADGADGEGVPTGGTAGQVLAKIDGTDFNTTWVDQTGGPGGGIPEAPIDGEQCTCLTRWRLECSCCCRTHFQCSFTTNR